MKLKTILVLSTSLLISISCSKNPAENVPAANVNQETNAPSENISTTNTNSPGSSTNAATAEGGTYFAFAPGQSSIEWVGSKVTGSHTGKFEKFTGEFRVVDG